MLEQHLNSLLREVVESSSLENFQIQLGKKPQVTTSDLV